MSPALEIHGNVYDPDNDNFELRPAVNPASTNYKIIQTESRLSAEQTAILRDKQCVPLEILVDNIYLCRYDSSDLTPIASLPFVKRTDVYHPIFKVQGQLQPHTPFSSFAAAEEISADTPLPASKRQIPVWIVLHKDAGISSTDLARTLQDEGVIDRSDTQVYPDIVDTVVPSDKLGNVALLECVRQIEEKIPQEAEDDRSRIVANMFLYDRPDPGHQIDNATEYTGAGQVIHIADTGFDKGLLNDIPPGYMSSPNRLLHLYSPYNRTNPTVDELKDTNGHGTHVCGCALLDATTATMGGVDCDNQLGKVRGTAPGAKFVATKVTTTAGVFWNGPIIDLLNRPYDDDLARISNHSYGIRPPQVAYSTSNSLLDEYIYSHDDLVVTWSAGNNRGTVPGSTREVNGLSCCKNIITVGNVLSARKMTGPPYVGPAFDPNAPYEADDFNMRPSSSRGPTYEGRYKPDVSAPGTCILSSLSRSVQGTPPPPANYGPSTDNDLMWQTGTSQAAPCVAGCAAIIRQALQRINVNNPSAALIKALLINGALDIYPIGATGPTPNGDEGFGRLNVGGTMRSIPASAFGGYQDRLIAGNAQTMVVNVPARIVVGSGGDTAGWTLKATLVWTDPGGAALVNIFGLAVTMSSAAQKRTGNKGQVNQWGVTNPFDTTNNVQQVVWRDIPQGPADITVTCLSAFGSSAPVYSLAWSLE